MLHRAVEQSPVSVCVADTDGVIQYVNRAFADACGYWKEELVGRRAGVLKSGTTAPEQYRKLWETIRSGRRWQGEFCNRRKTGELFWERESISPVFDAAGRITHFVAVKEDITRLRELEEQVRRSQRMEAVGALASGIAHELNNILAPMMMAPELLRDAVGMGPERELLDLIEQSARRASEAIRQLLTYTRGGGGTREILRPAAVLKDLHEILARTLPPEICLRLDTADFVDDVLGDASQIRQALQNLCSNACDAMAGGGTLTLRACNGTVDAEMARANTPARPGPHAVLAVSDTGHGMTPLVLERIFDPYFTTKGIGKGTGLGLPITLGIVRSHGGFVTVESSPGAGSTFRIHLPSAPEPK
jgi:PAS domain S-box-containing protein